MTASSHRFVALLATCSSLLISIFAGSAHGGWSQVDGPIPPLVRTLADDGTTLYLGNNEVDAGDIFRSTDGGANWENNGPANSGVNFVATHTSGVYAGTYISGLFRTTDHGLTWNRLTGGLQDEEGFMAFTALGTDTLLVGMTASSPRPLYRSVDAGAHWSLIQPGPSLFCTALASSGTTVFAGTSESGVFRSTDRGTTWAASSTGLPADSYIGAILIRPGAVLAGVSHFSQSAVAGIYRSTDGGAHWSRISVDLPLQVGLNFTSLIARGGSLLTGLHGDFGGQGLYRSTDGGVHWTLLSAAIPGTPSVDALLDRGGELLAGTTRGAFRTTNDGATWTYAGRGTAAIEGTTALFGENGALYLGCNRRGEGATGIWRTPDGGEAWTELVTGLPFYCTSQAFTRVGSDLLAGIDASVRGVYRSSDDGQSWTASSTGIPTSTTLLALIQDGSATLAGGYEGMYRSTDGGHAWSALPGFHDVYCFASLDGAVYAGGVGLGVRRSTDHGASWSDANAGLPGGPGFTVKALARHAGRLFAVANEFSVYRLDGSVWVPAGLTADFINDLADAGGALVAGTEAGAIFVSVDLGANWIPFDDGYHGDSILKLSSDGVRLYAGSRGHGVWSRPLAELPASASVPVEPEPAGIQFLSNAPDPFASHTTISLRSGGGRVSLNVYDASGREVARLLEGVVPAGLHAVAFDASRLAPGVYFCTLRDERGIWTKKMHVVQ